MGKVFLCVDTFQKVDPHTTLKGLVTFEPTVLSKKTSFVVTRITFCNETKVATFSHADLTSAYDTLDSDSMSRQQHT